MKILNKRELLAQIFEDTQILYRKDKDLAAAIEASKKGTKFYDASDMPSFSSITTKEGILTVSKARTFEAAMKLRTKYPNKRIAVLNFASATRPGGGVKNGSSAQEECLCRCSTLYPTLDRCLLWGKFYEVNRSSGDQIHTDACIYTPDIVIFKSDEDVPDLMKQEEWVSVDVISCAAPNLRKAPFNKYNPEAGKSISIEAENLLKIHEQRAKKILAVAADNGVDILVLGAFGCGAFQNDPKIVSKAYAAVLADYRKYFDLIEFAIFCKDYETVNYDVFLDALL